MSEQRKDSPLISVLMGVRYKSEDTEPLSRAVESVLHQTETNFELIICDDDSMVSAQRTLESYAQADPRVHLLRPGNMQTLPQKLNACLSVARGSYIARMDDDDRSHPERFSEQLCALHDHPEIAFVGCNVVLYREGVPFSKRNMPEFPKVRDFYIRQPFVHPTLLFRKAALERVGGYCEEPYCNLCEDYDLLLRLYAKGLRGMNLQEPLFDYTTPSIKGNRTMRHRWNETVTRWKRFRELRAFPGALPFVIKPLVVGLIPEPILKWLKHKRGYA